MGAKRTVFGTYGGKLKDVSITDLQTIAAKAALASANVKPEAVDSVIVGVVGSVSDLFLLQCKNIVIVRFCNRIQHLMEAFLLVMLPLKLEYQ